MKIEETFSLLDIKLSKAPKPVGSYVAYKIIGKSVYISGQISIKPDGNIIKGKVGKDLTLEQGQNAAYYCCLNILSQLKSACNNDLNRVKNCIKLTGFVNSTNDFTDQAKVINPASELLVKLFKEKGMHARAAVSVNSLPLGATVEIESIFEVN